MNNEKISIIIPVYNAEKNIKRCLKSVINQTYKNIEIIVVNDGSTDKTAKYVEEFKKDDNRIQLINKKNEGVSVARNFGIKVSKGSYINFVDSDDWLELNAIETLYKEIKENNVDLVRGNYYRNYDENKFIIPENNIAKYQNKLLSEPEAIQEFIQELYLEKIPSYVWLLLIKREIVFEKIFFKKGISMMEDTIFLMEVLCNCKKVYISDKKIYHYFCNEDSACKSSAHFKRNICDAIKINKLIKTIALNNNISKFNNDIKKVNGLHTRRVLINLYKKYTYAKKKIDDIYIELKTSSEFKSILENSDITIFSLQERMLINIFKKGNLTSLKIYFKFRLILSKIKDKILKREE